jgi:hypothetical protein
MSDPKAAGSENDQPNEQKENGVNSDIYDVPLKLTVSFLVDSSLTEMSSEEDEKDTSNKPSSKIGAAAADPPASHTLVQKDDEEAGFASA